MTKIKFKHSLKTLTSENDIVNSILEQIRECFDGVKLEVLKYNNQLIEDIMTAIENFVTNKKINKKNIVLKVFSELFEIIDLDRLDEAIEYIFVHKIIVKNFSLNASLKVLTSLFLKK